MSEIPCSHVCTVIYIHKQRPEKWLDNYYKMEKYMQVYANQVYGIEGPYTWSVDNSRDAILLPNIRRAPDRPKVSRKRAADEPPNPFKLTRSGYYVKCVNCGGLSHYYKGCHLPLNPDQKRWKPKYM